MSKPTTIMVGVLLVGLAGLSLLLGTSTSAWAKSLPDEKMEIRVDLGHKRFPTLFLRVQAPEGWWMAAEHEWWGSKRITGDPHTTFLLRRGGVRTAGSHDDTVFVTYEVPEGQDEAELLRALARKWIDDREKAGWSVRVPLGKLKRTSSLKAGRKRVRIYRGEFAANDNHMRSSATGQPEIDVYQVHGFVVGSRAVLMVTCRGRHMSQILDGLSLTIQSRKSDKLLRRVKIHAHASGPNAPAKRCDARIVLKLPKGARQVFRAAGTDAKPDTSIAAQWRIEGRQTEDNMLICLRADPNAAFDLRRQLTFWMSKRKDHDLLQEPNASKQGDRMALRCMLRQSIEEQTRLVAMHAFAVNGVHWYLSVEREAASTDAVDSKAWKSAEKVLKEIVRTLRAWETESWKQPTTAAN